MMDELERMAFITFVHDKIRQFNPDIEAKMIFAMISGVLMRHLDSHPVTAKEIHTLSNAIISYNEITSQVLGR